MLCYYPHYQRNRIKVTRMRVLFATNPTSINPYTHTLINGIRACDDSIICDVSLYTFWSSTVYEYDIIHVMWPTELLLSYDRKNRKNTIELQQRLIEIKNKKIKIVSTCHNLVPHYTSDQERIDAYDIVYGKSDMILHLGSYSKDLFDKEYPGAINKLIIHHVYDELFYELSSQKDSRDILGLSHDMKYILCFGAIRSNEERALIRMVAEHYDGNGVVVICPSYSLVAKRKNLFVVIKSYFQYIFRKYKAKNIIIRKYQIPDSELPYYFYASDIVLIPRMRILNSGNVSMAMLMGKAVVGPDCGNIGSFLKATGNKTFSVSDIGSVIAAIDKCFEENTEKQGKSNRDYALLHMTTRIVAQQLIEYYLFLTSNGI